MGKIKTWMEKPITRGDYVKACGWSLGITAVFYAIAGVYVYHDEIEEKLYKKFWMDLDK